MTVKTRQAARKKAEKHKVLFGGTIDLPFRGMLHAPHGAAKHSLAALLIAVQNTSLHCGIGGARHKTNPTMYWSA